jgi:hypothetical protein
MAGSPKILSLCILGLLGLLAVIAWSLGLRGPTQAVSVAFDGYVGGAGHPRAAFRISNKSRYYYLGYVNTIDMASGMDGQHLALWPKNQTNFYIVVAYSDGPWQLELSLARLPLLSRDWRQHPLRTARQVFELARSRNKIVLNPMPTNFPIKVKSEAIPAPTS